MGWLADAHAEWHAVNGRNVVCPLDCGATEGRMDEWEMEQEALDESGVREVVELTGVRLDVAPVIWTDPWTGEVATSEPPF